MPLYITEFTSRRNARDGMEPFAAQPAAIEQVLAIGAASVQSATFAAATDTVRVTTDVACSIRFGANPTATAANMRLAPGAVDYFSVPAGQFHRIAAITNT